MELFYQKGHATPLVAGCSAWLVCRLISEPHNQETYDLFIGEVVRAWADGRVFREGRWHFETADPSWRSLHHIAGGQFYVTGDPGCCWRMSLHGPKCKLSVTARP